LLSELSFLTPIATQSIRFFDVSEKNAENTQKGGQKGHFHTFSDLWLTQASLWLTWATKITSWGSKQPTWTSKVASK